MREELYAAYLQAPLTTEEKQDLEQNKNQYFSKGNFDGEPAFGTGGMRATVEPGSNHLNRYNIARLNLALAKVLQQHFGTAKIVIGADSRLSSPEFTRLSYHLLSQAGHQVRVYRRPTPTPMVSFAVRELKCQAGVMITASHNPPAYNGYKVYWSDGAQIVPPIDKEIQSAFNAISFAELPASLHDLAEKPVTEHDLIEEELTQKYLEYIRRETFITTGEKKLCILYSPLCGTGGWIFERVFHDLGFKNFTVLPEQKEPNGHFPNLKSANPEEKEAFELLVKRGLETGADLLLATDPDADRVGCAVRQGNDYVFLTGNQIGSLLLESIARKKAPTLKKPYLCKTIVTTEFQRHIGASHGIRTIETLTGFKYIAEILGHDPDNYVFGGEESYGYLPVSWIRDKDALSSALALAELAETTPLLTALDELYLKNGLYLERLHNINLTGEKKNLMPQLLEKLKKPAAIFPEGIIGSRKIFDILDLQKDAPPAKTATVRELQNNLAKGLVVQYWLEPEGRLTIRPSGTEPKIKVYVSLRYGKNISAASLTNAKKELNAEIDSLLALFLKTLGV